MVSFKVVLSDPKSGKSYQKEIEGVKADMLIGKKIHDEIEGILIDLPDYKLKITGGTDKDGFVMRSDLPGGVRKKILVTQGFGFKSHKKGIRRKRIFRGNTITQDIVQINMVITQYGSKSLDDALKEGEA